VLWQRLSDPPREPLPDGEEGPTVGGPAAEELTIPPELAILPLRGVVVYPLTAAPLAVGQPRSVRLIDDAILNQRLIGLVASRDRQVEEPGPDDVYRIGTVAAVQRLFRAPDGTIRLLVTGLQRITIEEFTASEPYLKARATARPELDVEEENTVEVEALTRHLLDQFRRLAELGPGIPAELITAAVNAADARQLVYTIASYVRIDVAVAQELLELDSVSDKLRRLIGLLSKELEVLELGKKIQTEAQSEMEKLQREFFLREQLKAIQRELGEGDEQQVELDEFRKQIEAAGMPDEARHEAERELSRLAKLPPQAAEYGVIRTYLEWLVNLPWNKATSEHIDIGEARRVLDEDHYDLEDIKERILEYLAVRKLRSERRDSERRDSEGRESEGREGETLEGEPREGETGESQPPAFVPPGPQPGESQRPTPPEGKTGDMIRREREGVILCFIGPPGVGKTSLGQSIARATGRSFIRQSLGGVHDEAEIRGFRRTYVGALPGRIIQALRRVESRNPVFMLDEVDKLGRDFRGDPAAALLEVLDPEQNREFRDHYLDVAFDLSQVMFICTANQLDTIPGPLIDRMEMLRLSGYTDQEKLHIAQQYLVRRQLAENGLRPGEVVFTDEAVLRIIRDYTREAGVRNLERELGRVCRRLATRIAEGSATGPVTVGVEQVREILRKPRFYDEVAQRTEMTGVATGLVWTPVGGDIIFVEAAQMKGNKGFTLTGQLGDVMQESARAALTYVRSKAREFGLPDDYFENHDIHVHVPAGAVPKDGPSAGVTLATALASLLSGRPVRSDVAMTGEITLRGLVLPIGGLKEKVLAAHRAGITTVILPERNEPDLDDIPEEVRDAMHFVLAERVDDVIQAALAPDGRSGGDRSGGDRAGGDRTGGDRAGGDRAEGDRAEGDRAENDRAEDDRGEGDGGEPDKGSDIAEDSHR
jgi:ATP-dependent Lon protease